MLSRTVYGPVTVGVPVTMPVAAAMDKPVGRPVADHVRVAPGAVPDAVGTSGVMAVPCSLERAPGLVTVTGLVMTQMKLVDPLAPVPSEAVSVTVYEPAVVGEPVMVPLSEPIDRPAGRPVADHVTGVPAEESVALLAKAVMAAPARADWPPGLVTVMAFACGARSRSRRPPSRRRPRGWSRRPGW